MPSSEQCSLELTVADLFLPIPWTAPVEELSRNGRPCAVREQERQHVHCALHRVQALDCLEEAGNKIHELPVDGADDELLEQDSGDSAVVEDVERYDGLLVSLHGA